MSEDTLTKDEVRQLLRECVTVVKPGETLVISLDGDWTPAQVREMQDALNWGWAEGTSYWPFRTLLVPGGELGVAEAPRAEPRKFRYHVGAPCATPKPDGTCGCPPAKAAAGA